MSKEEWPTDADVTDVIDSYFYDYSMGNDEKLNVELEHQREDMTTGVVEWFEKATLYDRNKAKIRAFDDIVDAYENNTGLGEHDEDLTDFEAIVDSIDHGIQMVGYRENEEEQE